MSGSVQHYCLRWNNHHSNLLFVFEHLFQTESFTDVTLSCEGKSIKCHKIVLAACSSYFQKLFIENECRHPVVILRDIKFSEIKTILEYMYKGEMNVAQDQLAGLLKAAETLRVKGLVDVEDNHHLSELSRSSRQSTNQTSVPSVSELKTSNSSSYPKTHSYPKSKFSSTDSVAIYKANYNSAAATAATSKSANSVQMPLPTTQKVAPSTSPKRSVSFNYESTPNEPVPLKKKRKLGPNMDTFILRTVLGHGHGHTSRQLNAAEHSSQTPSQTTSLPQKSLNSALTSNNSNGPIDHTEKMCGESPEQCMDDSIRSVESDKGLSHDGQSCHNDPEDKNGNVQKHECKQYKRYTKNDIMSAIEAVRQGMSALQAARKFSVPSRTLYEKVKKLGITSNRPYIKLNYETHCEKLYSESGLDNVVVTQRLSSPPVMNDEKEDGMHNDGTGRT